MSPYRQPLLLIHDGRALVQLDLLIRVDAHNELVATEDSLLRLRTDIEQS